MPDRSEFKLNAPYHPTGDQPSAIDALVEGISRGEKHQVLLGATGTGKTFTVANIIQKIQKPTLILAHNKTLAAQLYTEFMDFFPENAVEYFVSYYDYYQPEAYVPRHDLYIEKETNINEKIDRLRLSASAAVISRRDVIVVASVSCIYGLGNPDTFGQVAINLEVEANYKRSRLLHQLVSNQYMRNDTVLKPGTFRVRGDTLEIFPPYHDAAFRLSFFGDELESIMEFDTLTGEITGRHRDISIFPAKHFITEQEKMEAAIKGIESELEEQLAEFRSREKLLEAQRLEQRARYDLEMLREVGYCSGIENYSRHLDQRPAGSPPFTMIDYFPDDFLLVIDESHMTIPQVRGMYHGDRSRKETLVEYGFRLPSALDNRPLSFDEFEDRINQVIYTSATPGPYEMEKTRIVVEQIIRPTGLVDPPVEVRPVEGQVDDLIAEINQRIQAGERALVTTLTKRMAEDLSKYLEDLEIKVHYLHSEIDTLERVAILRDLRLGVYDVVVGINLLREGLDLPEVSLVAVLDADKEGFLRSSTSLIQTIGRAARHINGRVIMYADRITDSMQTAIDETNRRREKQISYNEEHGIEPASIRKAIRDITDQVAASEIAEEKGTYEALPLEKLPTDEINTLIARLEEQMHSAAEALQFEEAASMRDQIFELREILAARQNLEPWERVRFLAEG